MADRGSLTRRRTVTVAATVAALALIGAVAYGYAMPSTGVAASYRTVSPTRGDVQQAITTTGTLTPVSQVLASFPTSGRITAVLVHAGQRVTVGQKLATMDATPLEAAVLNAQATVAQDEVAIETDTTAIATGSTTSASVQSGGAPTLAAPTTKPSVTASPAAPRSSASPSRQGGAPAGSGGGGSSALLAAVTSAQQLADQACSRVLTGLAFGGGGARNASAPLPGTAAPTPSGAGSSTASPSASSPSASVSASSSGTPSSTAGSSTPTPTAAGSSAMPTSAAPTSAAPTSSSAPSSPRASATPSFSRSAGGQPSTGGTPSQQELSACLTSLSHLAAAERGAARALQGSLTSQGTATGRTTTSSTSRTTVTSSAARTPTSTSSAARSSTTGSGTSLGTGSGGSRAGGAAGGGSLTPAAQLLQDQGQLASDQQTLSQAQQHLDAATLTAPIAGVVGQVSLTEGATAPTTQGVTIIGPGAATVATTIALAQMPKVALGDTVQVDPVGSTTSLSGTVTTIGVLPASTSGSTPTYPLTVTIDTGAEGLPSGDVTRVSIVTAAVKDALTVPESALVATGQGAGTVTLLEGGSTSTVTVSTGAIGSGRVQILSGLSPTADVVIANLSEPLPSNTGFAARAGAAVGGIARQVRG